MEISNYTSYFLEARQPTQATTIENLKYETSCRNATLLIKKLSVRIIYAGFNILMSLHGITFVEKFKILDCPINCFVLIL